MCAKQKCEVVIGHAVLPVSILRSTRSHQSQTCQISDGKCLHCTTAAGKHLWPTRKMAVHPFGSHVGLVFADCAQRLWVCSYLWVVNLWQNIIVRKNVTNGNVRILHESLNNLVFLLVIYDKTLLNFFDLKVQCEGFRGTKCNIIFLIMFFINNHSKCFTVKSAFTHSYTHSRTCDMLLCTPPAHQGR